MHLLSFKINCARKCCASIPLTCTRQRSCSCDLQPRVSSGGVRDGVHPEQGTTAFPSLLEPTSTTRKHCVTSNVFHYLSIKRANQVPERTHARNAQGSAANLCKPQWHDRLEKSQQNVKFTFRVPDAYFLTDYCTKIGLPKSRIERGKEWSNLIQEGLRYGCVFEYKATDPPEFRA